MIARLLLLVLEAVLAAAAAGAVLVGVLGFVRPPVTAFMLENSIASLARGRSFDIEYDWVSHEQISPDLMLAVIAAEDQRFRDHAGFDFDAIEKAAEHNRASASIRGASTISQQVAKNLFLWPGRSYLRKGIEAYFTVLIELCWSKRRILEMYVNIAQFGDGTYGAEAAARKFFGVPASRLSGEQAALLAAVLPAPLSLRADAPSSYVRRRQHWILWQMSALGGREHLRRISPRLAR
jgi:monofunctional glycosyltransferase